MLLNLIVFVATATATFYLKRYYEKIKRLPTPTNVMRELRKIEPFLQITQNSNESEVETQLATKLIKFFPTVSTQYQIGGSKNARERVDIDVGNGQVGIEIKLARLLKKSNERNRLLGQIDLYRERKYKNKNLLVLIVGEKKEEKEENIIELKKILADKGVSWLYLYIHQDN
jgi:hypothetical protein